MEERRKRCVEIMKKIGRVLLWGTNFIVTMVTRIVVWLLISIVLLILHIVHGENSPAGRLNRAIYEHNLPKLEKTLQNCNYKDINQRPFQRKVAQMLDLPNGIPLETALRYREYEMVRLLVTRGADVNYRDSVNERTPLMMVILNNYPDEEGLKMIKFLLEEGANPLVQDGRKKSAYDYAQEKGNTEILWLLEKSLEETRYIEIH